MTAAPEPSFAAPAATAPDHGRAATAAATDGGFLVDVDGFEGPLDLLLALAREQRVDLRRLSIVRLAEQYLAYVAAARQRNLELAAEYLVMAAWLAYLKSRLLLPDPPAADEPSPVALAAALRQRLRRLDAIRAVASRLLARPRLGRDFFLRPPAPPPAPAPVPYRGELRDLLRAYARHLRRQEPSSPLRVAPSRLESVDDALARIRRLLGHAPDWAALSRFLPDGALEAARAGDLSARASVAATFAAGLQLAKEGVILLRQGRPFGPIYLKALASAERAGGG